MDIPNPKKDNIFLLQWADCISLIMCSLFASFAVEKDLLHPL